MAPILQNIDEKMSGLIDQMNPGNGYNLTWGQTNEFDSSRLKWDQIECNAIIEFTDEENDDPTEGAHFGAYSNVVNCNITINVAADAGMILPVRDIKFRWYKALDDIKKLFGTYYSLQGLAHYIQYRGYSRLEDTRGDNLVPISYLTTWEIKYEQDRVDVETYAC